METALRRRGAARQRNAPEPERPLALLMEPRRDNPAPAAVADHPVGGTQRGAIGIVLATAPGGRGRAGSRRTLLPTAAVSALPAAYRMNAVAADY